MQSHSSWVCWVAFFSEALSSLTPASGAESQAVDLNWGFGEWQCERKGTGTWYTPKRGWTLRRQSDHCLPGDRTVSFLREAQACTIWKYTTLSAVNASAFLKCHMPHTTKHSILECWQPWQKWGSSGLWVLSFPSFHHPEPLHHGISTWALRVLKTLLLAATHSMRWAECSQKIPSKLMALDLLQINIQNNYDNRTMFNGVIPLMPNLSNRFTGRTEVIAELKRYFFSTNDSAHKRKSFLLYGMGGIVKTQICLKFVEEMSDWWVSWKRDF